MHWGCFLCNRRFMIWVEITECKVFKGRKLILGKHTTERERLLMTPLQDTRESSCCRSEHNAR